MSAPRSPWKRAFNAPLLAFAGVLTVAGLLVLVLGSGNLAIGVGAGLLGIVSVVLLAGVFLAIGYGEDDERAAGDARR